MWGTNDYTHFLLHQSSQRDLQKQAQQYHLAKNYRRLGKSGLKVSEIS